MSLREEEAGVSAACVGCLLLAALLLLALLVALLVGLRVT